MSTELDRLRADLEVLDRYGLEGFGWVANKIRDQIVRLEAEADPWRDVKADLETWRKTTRHEGTKRHIAFYDHLTDENAKLAARVAELEDVKDVADMQPLFEGPIAGLDPILDPARVLATAAERVKQKCGQNASAKAVVYFLDGMSNDAKPYRLKGDENGS